MHVKCLLPGSPKANFRCLSGYWLPFSHSSSEWALIVLTQMQSDRTSHPASEAYFWPTTMGLPSQCCFRTLLGALAWLTQAPLGSSEKLVSFRMNWTRGLVDKVHAGGQCVNPLLPSWDMVLSCVVLEHQAVSPSTSGQFYNSSLYRLFSFPVPASSSLTSASGLDYAIKSWHINPLPQNVPFGNLILRLRQLV